MRNIYLHIGHLSDSQNLVLATVTRTSGSTPQKPGSSALFSQRGLVSGTIGGGIVEGKIEKIAIEATATGESGHFHFNLENDISMTEDAICGGEISVLVDASLMNSSAVFDQLISSLKKQMPGVLITKVISQDGGNILISRYWMSKTDKPSLPDTIIENLDHLVNELLASGRKHDYREIELTVPGEEFSSTFFLESVFPPEHLIIAGAGHIGRALAHIARLLDFEITVIDNRPEYANRENIPDADHIIVQDIGEALGQVEKNDNTYVVIVTRGHKDDGEALKSCLGSSVFYTGMIGSRRKVAKMRASFIEKGLASEAEWDRIYAPVGINILSQSVEEIAVSIAAELILVRNGRNKH